MTTTPPPPVDLVTITASILAGMGAAQSAQYAPWLLSVIAAALGAFIALANAEKSAAPTTSKAIAFWALRMLPAAMFGVGASVMANSYADWLPWRWTLPAVSAVLAYVGLKELVGIVLSFVQSKIGGPKNA